MKTVLVIWVLLNGHAVEKELDPRVSDYIGENAERDCHLAGFQLAEDLSNVVRWDCETEF